MEDIKKIIAENIVKYRKALGLTQSQLAEKLNYSDKAVSKWERGDSLPDIIVLKEMSLLFNISLDTLTSKHEERIIGIKKIWLKFHTNKFFITSLATILVWLVATLIFFVLTNFTTVPKAWLCFVYAIPVNFIVLLCLQSMWKDKWYNFLSVTGLSLSLALSCQLTFNLDKIWLLFVLCAPIIVCAFLWFITKPRIFKYKKKK